MNSLEGVSGQRVPDPDIHKRQVKNIAVRVLVPPHTITNSTSPTMLKSILDIPRAVSSQFQVTDEMSIDDNDNRLDVQYRTTYLHTYPMIIEMITGKVFDPFIEINWNGEDPLAPDSLASKINLKAIIKTHKLDLKQAAAFEILACSFILNTLDDYKVTEDELSKLFS